MTITKTTFRALCSRFRKEESGVAAIEGAMVMTMLSGAFVLLADMSTEVYTQNKLSNALRSSVQYIANEGRDLGRLELLFKDSFGSDKATLENKITCSCAKTRDVFTINENPDGTGTQDGAGTQDAGTQSYETETEVAAEGDVQDGDGRWAQCTMTCGGDPVIKYLEMTGSVDVHSLIKQEKETIDVSYSVRVE